MMECLKFLLLKPFNPRGSWTPCDRPFLRVCSCPCADVFSEHELSQRYPSPSKVTVPHGMTPDVLQHPLNSHFCKSSMCWVLEDLAHMDCASSKCVQLYRVHFQLPFIHMWEKAGMPEVTNPSCSWSPLLKNIMLENCSHLTEWL